VIADARIEAVECFEIRLPTRQDYRWNSLQVPLGNWLIVRLRGQHGAIGYGEATALPDWGGDAGHQYGETPVSARHLIERYLGPAIVGLPAYDLEQLHARMDSAVRGHPYAKGALDMAAHDLAGRALGLPAYALFGGRYRDSVPIAHSSNGTAR